MYYWLWYLLLSFFIYNISIFWIVTVVILILFIKQIQILSVRKVNNFTISIVHTQIVSKIIILYYRIENWDKVINCFICTVYFHQSEIDSLVCVWFISCSYTEYFIGNVSWIFYFSIVFRHSFFKISRKDEGVEQWVLLFINKNM